MPDIPDVVWVGKEGFVDEDGGLGHRVGKCSVGDNYNGDADGDVDLFISSVAEARGYFYEVEEYLRDLTGAGVQDTAIAVLAYDRALSEGMGSRIG